MIGLQSREDVEAWCEEAAVDASSVVTVAEIIDDVTSALRARAQSVDQAPNDVLKVVTGSADRPGLTFRVTAVFATQELLERQ